MKKILTFVPKGLPPGITGIRVCNDSEIENPYFIKFKGKYIGRAATLERAIFLWREAEEAHNKKLERKLLSGINVPSGYGPEVDFIEPCEANIEAIRGTVRPDIPDNIKGKQARDDWSCRHCQWGSQQETGGIVSCLYAADDNHSSRVKMHYDRTGDTDLSRMTHGEFCTEFEPKKKYDKNMFRLRIREEKH